MVVAGRASDLNSLLSSNKVFLFIRERHSRPHTGFNNVEYKLIAVPFIIILIAVCIWVRWR